MTTEKQNLVQYFEQNPQLKTSKYKLEDYTINYANRQINEGLTRSGH